MNFQAQPQGSFQYIDHTQNEVTKIKSILPPDYKKEPFCIVTDKSYKILCRLEIGDFDNSCPFTDTPSMLIAQKFGSTIGKRDNSQYFMKDLYVFLDREPCFMSGMGLVHSRIARLYFLHADEVEGCIVSNGHVQLNYLKNINHQYPCFKID